MLFEDALSQLEHITGKKGIRKGNWYMFLCPCHNDIQASLGVTKSKRGFPIYNCLAGCDWRQIKQAVERGQSISYYDPDKTPKVERQLVKQYTYFDQQGLPIFRKLRFKPKSFALQSFVNNRWVNQRPKTPVLYNLPQVIAANTVFILEGEKAVDALGEWGLVGTCTYNGASAPGQESKWLPDYNQYFIGKHVILLPDNDPPGYTHMQHVYGQLHNTLSKTILTLPGLTEKADFYDWAQLGYTKADLRELWQKQNGGRSP